MNTILYIYKYTHVCEPIFHLFGTVFNKKIFFPLISAPNNFKGLLLRSHVLYRLKHYQSSLADVENALKSRPTSYKVNNFNVLYIFYYYQVSSFIHVEAVLLCVHVGDWNPTTKKTKLTVGSTRTSK